MDVLNSSDESLNFKTEAQSLVPRPMSITSRLLQLIPDRRHRQEDSHQAAGSGMERNGMKKM